MIEETALSVRDFKAWLKKSRPGQKIEYFLGRLDQARQQYKDHKIYSEEIRCADQARAAARRGLVALVQRRIRHDLYSYLAIRRS